MVVYSQTAISVQDMLLEIKEDLKTSSSSGRGKHPAEVSLATQQHSLYSALNRVYSHFVGVPECYARIAVPWIVHSMYPVIQ